MKEKNSTMKKKLEITKLAPYLPYNLQFYGASDFWVMRSLGFEEICIANWLHPLSLSLDDCLADYSPMLKPLSDFKHYHITQVKEYLGLGKWCEAYDNFFDVWFDDSQNIQKLVKQAPYEIMQFFLKEHYDVFGLIEKGIAVEC